MEKFGTIKSIMDFHRVKKGETVLDVYILANTILQKAFHDGIPVTPMKLQKILYLVYREYLKLTGKPLFAERFEAWKYGPVLSEIYNRFKGYNSLAITNYCQNQSGSILVYDLSVISLFTSVVDNIWLKYKDIGAIQLSKMTHQPGSAWEKAIENKVLFLSDDDIGKESWE